MYYTDEPITKPEEDAFGRDIFVNNLANDIDSWHGGGSLVLALYGSWGTGKSSVLNLLQKKFEGNKSSEMVLFDPWYFNSTEQLIQTFLGIVGKKVAENVDAKDKNELQAAFNKYTIILSKIFSSVTWEPEFQLPLGPFGKIKVSKSKKKEKGPENPEDIRNDLRIALSRLNRRIVILIDNLDRLDPPELLLMFKLVRLCSDFPNFVYVLAFDHEQVRKLIKTQGVDPDFLDKIVQIDIELPFIDQNDIDSFVGESLQKLIKDLNLRLYQNSWDRFAQIYNQAVSNHLINNLRTAKRYLNSVSFTIPIVREEVDFADFLILEVLRVFYPRIYSGLPSYKKDLTSFEVAYGLDTMRKLRLAANKDIKEWIGDEVPDKKDGQVCEQLIGFLFPTIGAYFQNPSNPSIISRQDEHLANQRICAVEYFDMYFKFRMPKGEIASRIINSIEDELNKLDKEHIGEIVSLILDEKERLSQLLNKLYFRVNNLNPGGRILLITILGKLGKILEWDLLNSWNSSGSVAARVIIKCIERFENNVEIYNAIRDVISTTESLSLASELTTRLLSNEYPIQIPQSEKDTLKTIMIDRLHKEVLENKQNVFATYPTSYYRILGAWRSEQILGEREIATNYIYEQLSLDASALPKILLTNATFEIDTNKVHSFEFERLKNDYDVDKLYAILQSQESTASYSQIEQEVIIAFKKFMAKKISASNNSAESNTENKEKTEV